MNFVDKVILSIEAGQGGNGHKSFRHERYVNKGGPDGGDGGDGGNIIFEANNNQNTLARFRFNKRLEAEDGQAGGKSNKHGKKGSDLIVKVPLGTQIRSSDNHLIIDLIQPNQQAIVARGGKGGFGNAHFISSTRQAPDFAEKGEPGQKLEVILELKLIADIALIGLPNVGKSTLLTKLSNAKAEIADYPFTTLIPNLGVMDIDKSHSVLLADIPGLIEGASHGKGLGHQFLRHIERTKAVLHLVDVYSVDPVKDYLIIRKELAKYSNLLAKLPELVVLNKAEGLNIKDMKSILKNLQAQTKSKIVVISALSGLGLKELRQDLIKLSFVDKKVGSSKSSRSSLPVINILDDKKGYTIEVKKGYYQVNGFNIERFASRTDFSNPQAVDRIKDIMRRNGITHSLLRAKIKPGDTIQFGSNQAYRLEF